MQHTDLPGYVNGSQATASTVVMQLTGISSTAGIPNASTTPTATYPHGPYLMGMPENPYNNLSDIKIVAEATAFSASVDGTTGWLYKMETGEFKINYSGSDTNGTAYVDY